ncbi:MAG: type II toxin-antitoxin system HicA family toxin [Chitinispirillaceae bacterium]|jgi:predicted RNA binding protein YcfA (HicA-like mRNA interferase family)
MSGREKLLRRILDGGADANIPFDELCNLLRFLGFSERTKGSHHIFFRNDINEILNIQPRGPQAKPYQVKQIRTVIVKYRLGAVYND